MDEPGRGKARPLLIAIGGCSCSGKSALAHYLAADLNGVVLPVDAYYRDLSRLDPEARVRVNFDSPDAVDVEALLADLRRLAGGRPVERPVYDFTTHTRSGLRVPMPAAPVVILEGLFALYWREIRDLCRIRVFVDLEDHLCFERRLRRDTVERGRTPESVRQQYEETVRPMSEIHVLPTRRFADLTVSGAAPLSTSAAQVAALRL